MKILGLDSTANICCAAICEDEKLISEITVNVGNTHSETLLPAIESILKLSKLKVSDIELFSCSTGPGSFTGVRIGAATIKGLTFGRNAKITPVSALSALSYGLKHFDGIISPVINARRMQVYNALFKCENGIITRITPDRAISIEELDCELSKYSESIYLCGDAYELCMNNFKHTKPSFVPETSRSVSGYNVCQAALLQYKNGECVSDIELSPSYLRLSQAERERNERLNKQTDIAF